MAEVGDIIAHRYQLEARAGAGGGGTVFRARDLATGTAVAFKRLDAQAATTELEALAKVAHPAVIAPLDAGLALGAPYLVLPWLDGETLGEALTKGPMSVAAVLTVGARLASGLAAAHAAGVIHRDVKPANIVLVGGDPARATLIDFGVARPAGAPVTAASTVAGTPAYMAPEQARGDGDVDGKADVFALGCVLHEALTGRPAFVGAHAIAVVARILLDPVPRADADRPDAPAALVELIAQMLDKDPARRPHAHAIAERLASIDPGASVRLVRTLGGDERRTSSVVIAKHVRAIDLPSLRRDLAELGARLEVIGGATLAVTIDDAGAATDRAIAAARAALSIQRQTGGAAAVATGRSTRRGAAPAGEALDRAIDLLVVARAGDVVVDDATASLIESRFALRGGRGVRHLTGERTDGERRLLGKVTPLVGRDREVKLVRAVADEVRAQGAPRAIVVTGAAGLGKSRLFRELAAQLAGGDDPFAVWIGRGDPMRASSPFGVLAQLVRAGLAVNEGERIDRAFLRAQLAGHAEPARVAAFLGELLGLAPMDPTGDDHVQLAAARQDPILMHDQLRRAFADWLAHAAKARPIALLVDDAQWSDAPSLRFLDEAVRLIGEAPVLFGVFARPDGAAFGPELFRRHGATELRLGPLAPKAAGELVKAILGDRDPSANARIVERAGGNALYLEELIRAVAAGASELPTTVIAMVQARLDNLPPAARRALRVASLVGRSFPRALIATLTGSPDDAIATTLADLADREIVHRAAPSAAAADDEYAFRHEVVREACYDMLTDDDTRAGHRAAAEWLEAHGKGDPIVLATHYERGGHPTRAAIHLRRAAELALAANDFGGALAAARKALELGATEIGVLELVCAEACTWRGELAASAHAAERAADHLVPGDAKWFRAIQFAATVRGRFGDYGGIAAWGARALQAGAAPGARDSQVACLCALARTSFHGGAYAEASAIMRRVDELAPDPDALGPVTAAQVHGMHAAAARHAGDLGGDLAGYLAVLRSFEAAGDVRNACNTRVSVGFAFIELGDWDEADRALTAALANAEAMNLATVATRARQNLCLVLSHKGNYLAARRLVRQTIAESRAHGNARFEGWTEIYRAQIELAAGHADTAAQIAQQAAAHLAISPPARAGALGVQARALLATGDVTLAREAAAEAMQILEPLGAIEEFEAMVRLAWALVLDAGGETAQRDQAIEAARARLEARADLIREPRWRDSFLSAVGDNRETMRLYDAWLTARRSSTD
ncbi:MAG TPA: protein kinase [Kofleriaceae bacterium]|nr:protein kinase [Kofleriaceae bacterium]